MRYVFILNGREDKLCNRPIVEQQIGSLPNPIDYEVRVTAAPGDATVIVKSICDATAGEQVCFVACGGDGTVCEVASGLLQGNAEGKSFAIFAVGTGNDFIKYYPGRDFKSVQAIVDGVDEKIDALRVNDHFSVNVTNFGFDSVVASTANKMAAKGKKNPYRIGIVKAIFTARFNRIAVSADGEKISGKKMLLCTLANNHYVGGEFFCAPNAKNNDGLIDVCLVKPMALVQFLALLPIYTKGEHLESKKFVNKIAYRQAKHVEVDSAKTIELCLDGEMFAGTHFNIDILPGALTLRVPQK